MGKLRVDEMWWKKNWSKISQKRFVNHASERAGGRSSKSEQRKMLWSAEMAFIARSGWYHWFFTLLDDIFAVAFYFFYYVRNISIHPVANGDGCCGLCTTKWLAYGRKWASGREREKQCERGYKKYMYRGWPYDLRAHRLLAIEVGLTDICLVSNVECGFVLHI